MEFGTDKSSRVSLREKIKGYLGGVTHISEGWATYDTFGQAGSTSQGTEEPTIDNAWRQVGEAFGSLVTPSEKVEGE